MGETREKMERERGKKEKGAKRRGCGTYSSMHNSFSPPSLNTGLFVQRALCWSLGPPGEQGDSYTLEL